MGSRLERPRWPNTRRKALAVGYGLTAGTLYAACRRSQKETPLLTDGLALGLVTWTVGYLGWLPRFGLMAPVSQQGPKEVLGPIGRHVLFGIATAASYRWLHRWRSRTER